MSDVDPHVHVGTRLGTEAAVRNSLAGMFGLVGDLPTTVRTGCGEDAPLARTSADPAQVTCLPCRDFAHREHLALALQTESLGIAPGSPPASGDVAAVAAWHRETARRFAPG